MGRVPIASENKTGEGGDRYPRIKLTEKDQKTRFTIIEKPWREWVHYLKAPTFDDNGKPVKEPRQKRDGGTQEVYKLDFIAQPICLGDEDTLKDKGLDPANCPGCEASEKSGGDIPGPTQRFAVNVIEYALKGNSWAVMSPFSARVKVWAFTGRIYDEIEAIQEQIGDLRGHDITLECEDPYWQRNKLSFQMDPGHKYAPKGYIKELLQGEGNRATDSQLRDACGRETTRTRMQDDCEHAMAQWRRVRNEGKESPYGTSGAASLDGGIEDLLRDEGSAATPASQLDEDPFAEFSPETTTNPSVAARKVQDLKEAEREASKAASDDPFGRTAAELAAEQAKEPPQDDFNFDDLLV
jgi:hypothetical protein